MNKIPSRARNGSVPVFSQFSKPRATRTIPSAASGLPASRVAALQRGAKVVSPEAASVRTSTSPVGRSTEARPEFTSKLEDRAPISPVRCGPPGPPGKNGFDPYTTALPFVVLVASDGTLHRLFIKEVPESDPKAYTTYVEQEPYSL